MELESEWLFEVAVAHGDGVVARRCSGIGAAFAGTGSTRAGGAEAEREFAAVVRSPGAACAQGGGIAGDWYAAGCAVCGCGAGSRLEYRDHLRRGTSQQGSA